MSLSSTSDAAALRREARRRRILENSEKRLGSITGRTTLSTFEERSKLDTCFQSHRDSLLGEISPDLTTEKNVKDFLSIDDTQNYNFDEDVNDKTETKFENSALSSILAKRLHYILLSVVVFILFLSKLGFLFCDNIICPFVTMKLVEIALVQKSIQSQNPNFVFLMSCISKGSIMPCLFKAYSIIRMVLSDFFLYIFIFVLSYKLYDAFQESYLT